MAVEVFLDTNVLVYAVSSAEEDAPKHDRARRIVGETEFGVSAQVLQEFFIVSTRKIRKPITVDRATEIVRTLARLPFVPTDADLVLDGIRMAETHRISYWDAAILTAAARLDAPVVLSEDLKHGERYGTVRVVNPFLAN